MFVVDVDAVQQCVYLVMSSIHVEFDESSNDDRVVAEFKALLERSSPDQRERILDDVQQRLAELHQRGVELVAVRPSTSVVAYFVLKSLSAAHELDALYSSGELRTILEGIFMYLLRSSQTVRIKTLTWTVDDFNNCVFYFLQNLSK